MNINWFLPLLITQINTVSPVQLEGYVQTPIGGRPGSSSLLRPTLEELAIKKTTIVDQLFVAEKVYTGYQQIRAEGDTILKTALKTYGKVIPANSPFRSGIKFDWYRVGRTFPINIFPRWSIMPAVELLIFDFGYRFQSPSIMSGRTYRQIGLRLGLIVKNNDTIRAYFVSVPGVGRVSITTNGVGTQLTGQQSVQILFKDSQPLPNHLFLKASGEFTRQIIRTASSPVIPLHELLVRKKSLMW